MRGRLRWGAGGRGPLTIRTRTKRWQLLALRDDLFDFIRRADADGRSRTLSDDEVFAVSAFVLYLNRIVGLDDRLDADSLPGSDAGTATAYGDAPNCRVTGKFARTLWSFDLPCPDSALIACPKPLYNGHRALQERWSGKPCTAASAQGRMAPEGLHYVSSWVDLGPGHVLSDHGNGRRGLPINGWRMEIRGVRAPSRDDIAEAAEKVAALPPA